MPSITDCVKLMVYYYDNSETYVSDAIFTFWEFYLQWIHFYEDAGGHLLDDDKLG